MLLTYEFVSSSFKIDIFYGQSRQRFGIILEYVFHTHEFSMAYSLLIDLIHVQPLLKNGEGVCLVD